MTPSHRRKRHLLGRFISLCSTAMPGSALRQRTFTYENGTVTVLSSEDNSYIEKVTINLKGETK